MGIEAKLYVNGKDRHTTKLGMITTILSTIVILFLSGYFFYSFFEGVGMNLIYYSDDLNHFDYTNYELIKDNFIAVNLFDENVNNVDPRALQIFPSYKNLTADGSEFITTYLNLQPCELGKNINPKWKDYADGDISHLSCLQQTELPVILNDRSFIRFSIIKCENTTLNNFSCYSPDAIDNYINKHKFKFWYHYSTHKLVHYNKTHPVQLSIDQGFIDPNPNFKYTQYEWIKRLSYESDIGSVFEDKSIIRGFMRDNLMTDDIVVPYGPDDTRSILGTVEFHIHTMNIDRYFRSYMKLQTVAANIGGGAKFVLLVSQFIVKFVSYQFYIFQLSDTFIGHSNKQAAGKQDVSVKSNMILNKQDEPREIKLFQIQPVKYSKDILNLNQPKVKQSMSLREAIIRYFCNKKNKNKWAVCNNEGVIRMLLSSSTLIKTILDCGELKNVIFNPKQLLLFDMIRHRTKEELENFLNTSMNKEKHEINLQEEFQSEDKLTKAILKRIMN